MCRMKRGNKSKRKGRKSSERERIGMRKMKEKEIGHGNGS